MSEEILNELPEEERKIANLSLTMLTLMQGATESPIEKKMNTEHITKVLDTQELRIRLDYKGRQQNLIFLFAAALLIAALFIAVILVYRQQPEYAEKILLAGGGFLAGGLSGFGLGKWKRGE